MSGLCGWISDAVAADDKRKIIETMAAPLARFDAEATQLALGRSGAAAVCAAEKSAQLYQRDGVTVAIWGRARIPSGRFAPQAAEQGVLKTLADNWRHASKEICASLSGAFSLCIIDEDSGEALLAIDRMGTQPLSYQLVGNTLVFGSSADAIIRHPLTPGQIDQQGLYNYVYFHMVPSPGTVYKGQQRLLPGEYLHYKKGRIETQTYWRVQFEENGNKSFDDLKQEFLSVLRSSVRETSEDQSIGAFLSGGTDSSTIAGILCDVGGKPAKTYSIGFEAQGYDEMEYARIASRHFKTDHHEYYVTPDDVVNAIPQIAAVFDEPFGNASAVPAYYCARMAKADGVTRMLGGDGGDELFGGNERYSKQQIFALYEQVPSILRKALLEPAVFNFPGGKNIKLLRKARSYIEQASTAMPARLETYNLLGRYGPTQVFTKEFLAETDVGQPLANLVQTYDQCDAISLINRMLALDLKITLADNDLPKVVKSCELAGMEVAFPFLTDDMVAFSAQLTPQQKLNGTQLRYFFKEALRGFLPDEIITKQKHGFGLPFGVWLQQHKPLLQLATDSLNDLKKRKIVNDTFIDQLVGQHLNEHAGYHGTMVWVLMMMEQWFKRSSTT